MFKTERMKRVLLLGTMDALPETVDFLYRTGSFHIIDYKETDDVFDIGTPLPEAERASRRLLDMMSISQNLDMEGEEMPLGEKIPVKKIRAEIDAAISNLELEISSEAHARKEVENLLAEKNAELSALHPLKDIDLPLALLRDYDSLAVFAGRLKSDPLPEISALGVDYDIIRGNIIVLFIEKKAEARAAEILGKAGFSEVALPKISEKPLVAIHRLNSEIGDLEKRLAGINSRIDTLRQRHGLFVMASLEELSIEANRAETPLRFGTGHHSFIVDAWIPSTSMKRLQEEMSGIKTGVTELIELDWNPKTEEPPIRQKNPRPARPMEMLMEMFSLPKYDEVDPTFLMFLTFPLFYGLMLGDMGYGIAILALVLSGGFTKLMKALGMGGGAPGLNRILLYSGISTVIFGFLFDEFFGFPILGHHFSFSLLGIEFPVDRVSPEMVGAMLLLCVYIGIAHLFIGYVMGFFTVKAEHGLKEAVLEKGGWILILVGFVLFSFSALPALMHGGALSFTSPPLLSGIVLLVIGIVMTYMVEGINSVLELPGLASNLLSYTRIYAIGLSSVGIALAFNENMAMPAIEGGGAGIAIGIIILIMGHSLNLALGLMGPLIQTLRLHYVEFFSKFYIGGGEKFNPLRYRRKYTKEA